jgi:DNA-directed RNA polymerase subunit M/transcription elongation factor TFIIS
MEGSNKSKKSKNEKVMNLIKPILNNSKDAEELNKLTFKDGDHMLRKERFFLMELVSIANQTYNPPVMGFLSGMQYLKSREFEDENDVIYNQPLLENERIHAEVTYEFLRNKQRSTKSVEKCPKCGSNETFSSEKQIRSADEPMTIFFICMNPSCGKKWKI